MNRLAVQAASDHQWQNLIPTPPHNAMATALVEQRVRSTLAAPVASFLPLNYEPGYAYPLLVWLHDRGGSERHLPQVMQHLSTQNFVAVAPRGSHECSRAVKGHRWVQQPAAIAAADAAVSEAIQLARQEFSIHEERVFLIGHGDGGSMALRLALQSPHRFAGAASLNGRLPRRHCLLRNINDLRSLPLFVASTREYQGYPELAVCSDLRLLHSAGCSVSLRQYPGDDDLTTCMLADVNRWVMEQVCGN
jgi:phospholipase/carboxylesterase